MNQMKDNTLTISELAERWGMSRATIYRNRVKGRLPSIDFLGNVRFKLSDIEEIENDGSVVFRDVILLALTGFIFMVVLLLPFVNPPTENENNTDPPGNVIVELFWDNDRDVDIDLWVKAPDDIPVGYSNKGGLFFNLLRDDLGKYKDNSPINYEVSYSRGISEGNYIANLHLYREDLSPFKPINAKLVVSVVEPQSLSLINI